VEYKYTEGEGGWGDGSGVPLTSGLGNQADATSHTPNEPPDYKWQRQGFSSLRKLLEHCAGAKERRRWAGF